MKKGTTIYAEHLASGKMMNYLIIDTVPHENKFGLVNMDSYNLMKNFAADTDEQVVGYIENTLKCKILGILEPKA